MSSILAERPDVRPLLTAENRPASMAKATLRSAETGRLKTGRAVGIAMHVMGWSLKELAREAGCDERQLARQITGAERVQFDRLFEIEGFEDALIVGLARACGRSVKVHTTIVVDKVRRGAK